MAKWVFLNNDFVSEEDAVLHFRDLSFQRGYGVFDFFRLAGNEPLFLDDHLERFYYSATEMYLPVPLEKEELRKAIFELIERNNLPGTGVRLSLTGGESADGFSIGRPNLLLSQHSFSPPTIEQRTTGIRLLSHPHQRPLPQIKSINYEMAIWLQPKRMAAGADDILYHQNGFISECPRSNFFLVMDGNRLVTPAGNVLAGITRKKVLQLASEFLIVEERPVQLDELALATEAFITSTTKEVLPVCQVDENRFLPGPVTQQLLHAFHAAYLKEKAL